MPPRPDAAGDRCRVRRTGAGCVAVLTLVAGCASAPPAPAPQPGTLRYAYVVLAEAGQPVARAITSAAACPSIELDGGARPMTVRAAPAVVPARAAPAGFGPAKAAAFPVLACELRIPAGVTRATVEGRVLPLPKANPQRIVVLGDTGCRLAAAGAVYQRCNDAVAWPFAAVADAAAAAAPDLVIHVGDFHYRESPCPPGDDGCRDSPWGYGWDAWEADLFAPAQKLLAAAPWIVVRGNHESCARAGQGWYRFVDPQPAAPRRACDDPADDAIGDYSEPYAVPFGTTAAADTQFIVFDSSLAGLSPLTPAQPMYGIYRAQMERAFALAAARPHAFFLLHHPVLGFASNPRSPSTPYPGNAALQSVLKGLHPAVLFPAGVDAVLAGHNHLFEAVGFVTPHPPHYIVGNGGSSLDSPFPVPFPAAVAPAPGAVVDNIAARHDFGFATMERDAGGWRVVDRDTRGTPQLNCRVADRRSKCAAAGAAP